MKTDIDSALIYWASFNRFSLRIPGAAVLDIARPGSADAAVSYWAPRILPGCDIFGRVQSTREAIRAELREYGAWDAEELADDGDNWRRLVWLGACGIAEDDEPDASEPLVQSAEVGPFRVYGI